MKFIVDEMPFWADDCPFYNWDEKCQVDGCKCNYMTDNTAGNRQPENCRWLEERSEKE